MPKSQYHLVCGLEIHLELNTASKMFCGCANDPFHTSLPNSHTCPVCLGMPGGLPVPNKKAIEWTIKLGLFLGCQINLFSKFDRKNYFYPDLPKGYQISQYDLPFCYGGQIETDAGPVGIERIHLEEDAGKLIHAQIDGEKVSLVDFNRSGVPLVEIVTKPDIKTAAQAVAFAKKLRAAIRYLGIGNGDMEKGEMRLEANISLQTDSELQCNQLPSYKVEVKNINSFNFMQQAIEFEVARQSQLLAEGQEIKQETRGFNNVKQITFPQRSKGNAADYRYFPDPDIPSIVFNEEQINQWRQELPPSQTTTAKKWAEEFALSSVESSYFLENRALADFAATLWVEAVKNNATHERQIDITQLAKMMINKKIAWQVDDLPDTIIHRFLSATEVTSLDEEEIKVIITQILKENQAAVNKYHQGQKSIIGFFIGEAKHHLGPKADIKQLKSLIENQLLGLSAPPL